MRKQVASLREAINRLFGHRTLARREDEADLRAFERRCAEVGPGASNREVERRVGAQDPVARIEVDRARLAWPHRDAHVEQGPQRPDGILDLDVEREQVAVVGATASAGRSIAMPSRPPGMFIQPYA